MKTRYIKEIGMRASLRVYWGGGGATDPRNDVCPNCFGHGRPGYHNAELPLARSDKIDDWSFCGKVENYSADRWPTKCDHCGKPVPSDVPVEPPASSWDDLEGRHVPTVNHQVFYKRTYNTASGDPEPGDVLEVGSWYHRGDYNLCEWSNCDGRHLQVILPNGETWHVTGRASNCTMPKDTTHRCWVVHEEAPGILHVDKRGNTCAAGAGSIAARGWHGFLHHGELTGC